jgi:hypothetical protein
MKLHVITNEKGEVIGTMSAEPIKGVTVRIEPVGAGHTLHENVHFPDTIKKDPKDVDGYHRQLAQHLVRTANK